MTQPAEHRISVVKWSGSPGTVKWFQWVCSCSALGHLHETHQRAYEFGVKHLEIMTEEPNG